MSEDNFQELSALVDALRRKIDALSGQVDDLEGRLEDLEAVVDTDLDAMAYEQMTKQDKVRELRAALIRQAEGRGKAAMTYDAVMSCFGGRPSPGHAYDLMRVAGQADGFDYQERTDRDNRIVVKIADVNDDALVHAANNGPAEEAA